MSVSPLRVAYLDCFAGISGDMFLGALLGAGVPASILQDTVAKLNIEATLRIETVLRSGISALKVFVLASGEEAEGASHAHPHTASGSAEAADRSLSDISTIIAAANLGPEVQRCALHIFELLAETEARVHGIPLDAVHFHEVGAVDAIVDVVAASAGIEHLRIDAWYCSPVNVGSGMVACAHGLLPVPAPATADLLQGFPTYAAHLQKELTTPTGAAILKALSPSFGPQPSMHVERIGYGAGKRNPENFPNVLRLSIGRTSSMEDPVVSHPALNPDSGSQDVVTVLETALDDLSPQVVAYVAERALASGALDVMLTPVLMKKGRPGTLLTVLCTTADSEALQALLFRETSTLGIRVRQERRATLERRHIAVETAFGPIRVKVAGRNGTQQNLMPEYEDCRAAAALHQVPLKEVQQAALFSLRSTDPSK